MGYNENLQGKMNDQSNSGPVRPGTASESLHLQRHAARSFSMASSPPPATLAQRSLNPSILTRGNSLYKTSRPESPNAFSKVLKPPRTFYMSPKILSGRETSGTARSDFPQESMRTHHQGTFKPKPTQSAIVTTTSITRTHSSSGSSQAFSALPISRQDSIPAYQTTYMKMLLGLDKISKLDNILIAFFNWIILAGFLIFPATYISLEQASKNARIQSNATARAAVTAIQHVPLLVMAYTCCGIGCAGIFWLWWKLRMNHVWLCNKIFFTICLNSLAGLVSTLISVYGQKNGYWSVQAMITTIVTGGVCGIAGVLYLLYNFVFLAQVKSRHDAEMAKIAVEA